MKIFEKFKMNDDNWEGNLGAVLKVMKNE